MELWSVAAIALMVVLTLWWVLQPLWQTADVADELTLSPEQQMVAELEHRREAIYAALHDLEHDLAMTKIDEADYQRSRAHLIQEAAEILQKLDALRDTSDQELEDEIDSLLASFQQPEPTASTEVSAADTESVTEERACPSCGHEVGQGDVFCARCGTRLSVQVRE